MKIYIDEVENGYIVSLMKESNSFSEGRYVFKTYADCIQWISENEKLIVNKHKRRE